ncbi:exonuclease V subunit gamma [Synechococcus sp. RSCCF101]|uniref:exodeoxyribonuclease V subunit gamma n=1 Tax=Synechococcus sp. RSCCF101 TaxID=2511069 RepID=UPI001243E0F8|nr:exodeoxyribonuclease V subunit gamma [Synechococcus sp. RSCCF101]QEY31162.1 exonuclease V subunit gamma [Synechococcus sp. RSCCF101]
MLVLHRSNRAEWLAALLAEQLRLDPPSPWQTLEVMVNTWPTSRWLSERLALALGTSAQVRFPFPGSRLRRLVDELLAEDEAAADDWRANRLVWAVLDQLEDLMATPEGAVLAGALGPEPRPGPAPVDRNLWSLARAIADALDDYGLYRVDELSRWWMRDELSSGDGWQAQLTRRLAARLAGVPFGLRARRAIEALRRGRVQWPAEAGPLRLFGISSLAPIQIELLQAVSGITTVEIYLLTPGPDLWQRCADRRAQLSEGLTTTQQTDPDWLLQMPTLEGRFGRLGAEFQQLLEGTGVAQLGPVREEGLFHRPAHGDGAPLLLHQLQQRLLGPDQEAPLRRAPEDTSLEFHACPGRLRQIQIVRDRILQLLAADPTLQPRHVLVMTPQVDRFAPLLGSVLSDSGATGVTLPWRLTDRSQDGEAGPAVLLLRLLRLADERVTASELETLLSLPCLLQAFALEASDSEALNRALQEAGFRWGCDGRERGGDPRHTLSWALERLLLGLVLPEATLTEPVPDVLPAAAPAPFPVEMDLERLGPGLQLLLHLRDTLIDFRRPRPAREWCHELRDQVARLSGGAAGGSEEPLELERAIAAWGERAAGHHRQLTAAVVADGLEEDLAADSGRFGHRSGALTISALEPMRAIPHRVIVLMGLDATCFPRHQNRPGFHLLEQQRRLGDPSRADQDRYALLEALMSARQHLVVTWTSRDERSGEPLPPALPVQQWIDLLQLDLQQAAPDGPARPAVDLVQEHPANPLERSTFLGAPPRPPASCDRRLLAARRQLEQGWLEERRRASSDRPTPPAAPDRPPLVHQACPPLPQTRESRGTGWEELMAWLQAPQRLWLRRRGLNAAEWVEAVEDLDPIELAGDRRRWLLQEALEAGLADGKPDPLATDPPDWPRPLQGTGDLPGGSAAELAIEDLDRNWRQLVERISPLGAGGLRRCRWRTLEADSRLHGDTLLLVELRRSGGPAHLELWARLLLALASGQAVRRALLIGREGDKITTLADLQAPEPGEAVPLLEQLLELMAGSEERCWPVPPRSGWAHQTKEHGSPGKGFEALRETWEGSGQPEAWSERERAEMLLCFGEDCAAEELCSEEFLECCRALYTPLLERLR